MCVLAALMGAALVLHTRSARADNATLTIVHQDGLDAAYDGYQIFSATMGDDELAREIQWTSDEMRQAVLATLDAQGYADWFAARYPHSTAHDSARAAAEYLIEVFEGQQLKRSAQDYATHQSARTTLSNALARALVSADALDPQVAQANEPFSGAQGYWLFVSRETASSTAGTAPLFVALGPSPTSIVEKASSATIAAQVREDATGTWGKTADAQRGELVAHQLTATLPQNLSAFDRYRCRISCALPEGMTLHAPHGSDVAEDLAIRVGTHVVDAKADPLAVRYVGNELSIEIDDLTDPAWADADLSGQPTISVDFDAFLNAQATVGAKGNLCRVQLTSTIDPVREREATTPAVNTAVFCYDLDVQKVDGQSGKVLEGAVFELVACADDDASHQSYVQADGSVGAQAHRFATDEHGMIHISGLDAGRYLLREAEAPQGYALPQKDIELLLDAERLDESLSLSRVSVSVTSGDAELASLDDAGGRATIRVRNTRMADAPTDPDDPRETTRRLAQTGVGMLCFACLGLGLALRSLGAYPLPSESVRYQKRRASRPRP